MAKIKNKTRIYFIIFFFIILFFLILFFKNNNTSQELLLSFLKLNQNKNIDTNIYYFHVLYQNKDFQKINLINTMNNKIEKIQPGAFGEFEIWITSSQNMKVRMEIIDKPDNLLFYIDKEKLEKNYFYEIYKNEFKKIKIKWEWRYEVSELEDKKDTEKGKNLEEYQFKINIKGEEVK